MPSRTAETRPRVEADTQRGSYPQSCVAVISRRDRLLLVVYQTMTSLESNQKDSPYTVTETRWITGTIRLATFAYSRAQLLPRYRSAQQHWPGRAGRNCGSWAGRRNPVPVGRGHHHR